ncbi:hypothetical protein MGYG_06408 [Nannizzia gypsea CBS 118893]|uniref:tRNA-specific adenosine-34 deaminase subunit Tad3 n=1 Tax=Arthroderma gypseum (strain ATCC MYA-4604 / CBS 118893) TaxID=535722 RepID=E4UZ80_ARTGP|nr:hypothetical protein MGYG_06408 [Nannizzia gypsea CBS 118893]EFR03410.1 hypothetical protein MGYG_06408 [Nannizzia gypsea CBS 118893]
MAAEERLKGIKPLQGEISILPSIQELRPVDSFEEAYVAEIDIKSSNVVVKLLDTHYPRNPEVSRSHLRRLLRPDSLPEPLKQELDEAEGPKSIASIHVLIPPPLPEPSEIQALLAPYTPRISPPSQSEPDTTTATEQPSPPPEPEKQPTVRIQKTLISTKPPTTPAEALEWSRTKWSTIYNPAARNAAHAPPQVQLVRAKASISPRAGFFLALAKEVANESVQSGRGRGVGVVIADPELTVGKPDDTDDLLNSVVAVSGDTRWWKASLEHKHEHEHEHAPEHEKEYSVDDEAGPENHAVMRGISMVSRKRIASNKPATDGVEVSAPSEVESAPISSTSLESHFFQLPNLLKPSKGGYLCTGLDLYTTHEPCICCSMGMLLSRFRSITVLNAGMRRSAEGNALDAVNGYGLHWREELNWRAIGFEFLETGGRAGKADGDEKEFNA